MDAWELKEGTFPRSRTPLVPRPRPSLRPVKKGEELFISYGASWFSSRRGEYPKPFTNNLKNTLKFQRPKSLHVATSFFILLQCHINVEVYPVTSSC